MRFIETTFTAIGEDQDPEYATKTKWWFDTERPLPPDEQTETRKFVAVQTYADRDPNQFIRHDKLFNLFNDQAEYYHVCDSCYATYHHAQWGGSTRMNNWRQRSDADLNDHLKNKGWCEFCDPIFGNGGWIII